LGQLLLGPQGHDSTGESEWRIDFALLLNALAFVEYIDDTENEEQWQALAENCTDKAILVGLSAGIQTLDPSGIDTPKMLSDYLKNDDN
jgi:hypothetical protein